MLRAVCGVMGREATLVSFEEVLESSKETKEGNAYNPDKKYASGKKRGDMV